MKSDSIKIAQSLEEYGFTPNEAQVYVYLLSHLEATAFEVAKTTGIPRSTVYTILESLKKQGFISQFRKNNVAYFTQDSPNQLLNKLKQKEEIINEILPQIRAIISRDIDTPISKLYVGLDGVKIGLEDILETIENKKIKQICATSQPDLLEYLPKYFPTWLKKREELGVFTKLILPQIAEGYLKSNQLREVRVLPERFPFTCSITIYDNKATFFSFENDNSYCIIIESASVVDMLTKFFLFTWEMLGGVSEKKPNQTLI